MEEQTTLTLKTKESKRPVEGLIYAPLSDSPSTVLALIERVALAPRANVEKLAHMIAMYERVNAREAELAFNAAKGRILKKLAGIKIVKNRPVLSESGNSKQNGAFEAFKYAPLEEIDEHLRPLLAEEQMDLSYSNEPWDRGGILIRGRLKHVPGGTGTIRHHRWQVECQAVGSTTLSFAAMSPVRAGNSGLEQIEGKLVTKAVMVLDVINRPDNAPFVAITHLVWTPPLSVRPEIREESGRGNERLWRTVRRGAFGLILQRNGRLCDRHLRR